MFLVFQFKLINMKKNYQNLLMSLVLTLVTTITIIGLFIIIPPSIGGMTIITIVSIVGYLTSALYFIIYKQNL